MKQMCKFIDSYKCNVCNNDTLFFVTKRNTLIDYKNLIRNTIGINDMISFLEDRDIQYIKCLNCNKKYLIDWRNKYPENMTDSDALKDFGI